jgi:hypothetical protein
MPSGGKHPASALLTEARNGREPHGSALKAVERLDWIVHRDESRRRTSSTKFKMTVT